MRPLEYLPWVVKIKEHLSDNNLDNLPPNQKGIPFIYKKMYEILIKKFQINALSSINNPKHKLRTYALFKTVIGTEKYLQEIRNLSIGIQFSKFRLSDHNLEIEKGRHKGLVTELRFCPFCDNEVENEIYFLLVCPLYTKMREAEPCFQNTNMILSDAEKFVHLISEGDCYIYT